MAEKFREGCIVCQIIGGKVPSKKIYEDERALAILDINPANPGQLMYSKGATHTFGFAHEGIFLINADGSGKMEVQ